MQGELKKQWSLSIPADKIDTQVEEELQKLAGRVRLDGFRVGKVPMRIVKQRFGTDVRYQVVDNLVREMLVKELEEKAVKLAGSPAINIEKIAGGEDVNFTVEFEVMPEIDVINFNDIVVDKNIPQITDQDIDKEIDILLNANMLWKEVNRPAAEKDRVTMDFNGFIDGKKLKGGQATDFATVIGSGQLIKNFEDGLVGKSAGEQFTLDVQFPADYHAKELRNKFVKFDINLKKVEEGTVPELQQEFFDMYQVTDLDGLKTKIRDHLEKDFNKHAENELKEVLYEKLLEKNPLPLPDSMIEEEKKRLMAEQRRLLESQSGNKKKKINLNPDDFTDSSRRNVQLQLLLREYVKQKDLKADNDKVRERLLQMAGQYGTDIDATLNSFYQSPQLMQWIESQVMEEMVSALLMTEIKVNEKPQSYEAFMRSQAAEHDHDHHDHSDHDHDH